MTYGHVTCVTPEMRMFQLLAFLFIFLATLISFHFNFYKTYQVRQDTMTLQ